ncbi:hypothetical protein FJ364_05430, partial [Candidatus Dependentiae bacterium]|nr:hypothetical protein [Candidatus Dependentiae bacterium]
MPISNSKEEIDTRILRLIGLEDVFDLDYETYLTLLKEAMVKSRMTKKTIPTEEVMLLTEEYKRVKSKRVKSKKDSDRFEVKKKKISASSFNIGGIKGKIAGTTTKSLPGTAIGASPLSRGLEDSISTITSAVISIAETLKQQRKTSDDSSAYDKRKAEQEKRGLAESKLEKRFEGLKKAAEKIIAPVKSLLDRIIQFFTTVIMGRIVYKLVEWLGDPSNASKVKSIIRFVKDWWPALLGSYILFGTSFGKLIRGTVGLVGRFIFQIGKVAIPQLLKFIKSPVGIGLGLFTAGATVPAMFPGTVNQQERQTSKQSGSKEDKIKSLQQQKANLNFFEKLQGKGSEIDEQVSYLQTGKTKSYGFNGGGLASGFVSGEKGVDKVPAMLSDGEFVMSRGAVSKYGVDTLEAMNAAGGGTNKPKVMSGTTYAQGGGMIGDIPIDFSVGENPDDNTLRRFARIYRQYAAEEDLFKAFKKLNFVPKIEKMVGGKNNADRIFQGHHGYDDALDAIRQSVADKIKAVNNPQSFTQSSRAAAGLDDLAKKFDMDAKTSPRYAENLPKLNKPKPNLRGQFTNLNPDYFLRGQFTNLNPDYFLRGQFSNLPADYFSKAAKNVRAPIPATSAIVPYTGGGLART